MIDRNFSESYPVTTPRSIKSLLAVRDGLIAGLAIGVGLATLETLR
jgi:hypothetical protein